MVIIDNLFIHYKQPVQYLLAGEKDAHIYKRLNKSFQKTRTVENASVFDPDAAGFAPIRRELADVTTGVVLNSANYIFNILDFEKIPLREEMRREIVEWRLRKVFPESIDEYDHRFYMLDRKKILSILLRKSFIAGIEERFAAHGLELIYMGNSTVNIMNRLLRRKNPPDFFIEVDRDLFIIVFQQNAIPFYIRKFRNSDESGAGDEVVKTINYVKNSYSMTPRTYSLISADPHTAVEGVRAQLAALEIRAGDMKHTETLFLPG